MKYVEFNSTHFELNKSAEPDGKRHFKMSLHEIYPDREHCNNNGICYLEQYTERNMETVVGMPLCCEFADNRKREPIGHGVTGEKDGMPIYEDSIVVGAFDGASIEKAIIEGQEKLVLVGTGIIYEQRYPQLVEWIEERLRANMVVRVSVEFVGTSVNDGFIKYENDYTDNGRVPTDYRYSGCCLLTVPAGDDAAILFELNQGRETSKMDEQMKKEINDAIIGAINEMRSSENELRNEIESLKAQVAQKDAELCAMKEATDKSAEELKDKEAEIEACKKEKNEAQELCQKTIDEMNAIKASNLIGQLNSAVSQFSDKQREVAVDEINSFNADPINHASEINQIVDKIAAGAYRDMVKNQKKSEKNSMADIFAGVDAPADKPAGDFNPQSMII